MKNFRLPEKTIILIFLLVSLISPGNHCEAQRAHFIVDSLVTMIDGDNAPFNQIAPGDTVFLSGGRRDFLLIRNIHGEPGNPVVFLNSNGVVVIDTDHYFGILVENCRFIRITGTGSDDNFYGFQINRVSRGAGVSISKLSSDFELDHVSVKNVLIGAIYAKSDPDCLFNSTREKFTQYNTVIHDNYIENAGNEGMYIGSSKYFGQKVHCNETDTLLLPSLLDGVSIYNNIINYACWDGIQVSSASNNCRIYDNLIMFDSQSGVFGQMSGILIGGGSKCDCYNNYIADGNGDGIESHGLGGYMIYNNVIENAGRDFFPLDPYQMKYGILVTDISVQSDSSFPILHNDIINPKSDGIRFLSLNSKQSLIASNVIINPGNFDFYETGNFGVKGIDSYVMEPDTSADIILKNNYFSRTPDSAGFVASSFSLRPDSRLIDAGYAGNTGITFDFYRHIRPYGNRVDIGAIEFNPAYMGISDNPFWPETSVKLFPDPVTTSFTIVFPVKARSKIVLNLYDLSGKQIEHKNLGTMEAGIHTQIISAVNLSQGIYLYRLRAGNQCFSGRFIKSGP
jgi:hypothetical protein